MLGEHGAKLPINVAWLQQLPNGSFFGTPPNLPNIMTAARPPALDGTNMSGILARHLNALHAVRKAFIESEADERIRRALRSKMRASEEGFNHGDRAYCN